MKIEITTKNNCNMTEDMQSYLSEKLKFLKKYINEEEKIKVTITIEKRSQKIKIVLLYMNEILSIKSETSDFYETVDKVTENLKKNILKIHDMKTDKGNKKIPLEYKVFSDKKCNKNEDITEKIVKRKSYAIKPMTEKEAISEIKLLGHEFYMFVNTDLDYIPCLLYKRNNGGYGLIESCMDEIN